jgi:hypothetical protein
MNSSFTHPKINDLEKKRTPKMNSNLFLLQASKVDRQSQIYRD